MRQTQESGHTFKYNLELLTHRKDYLYAVFTVKLSTVGRGDEGMKGCWLLCTGLLDVRSGHHLVKSQKLHLS